MARLYQRGGRWWGDFREFHGVGGDREPLRAPGQAQATTDRNLAAQLFGVRLKQLEDSRDDVARGRGPVVTLAEFSAEHIVAKRQAGKVTEEWLLAQAVFLERAIAFLGASRRLTAVGGEDIERWIAHLRQQTARTSRRPLSEGSVRHHLNALSNLYRRAQARRLVPPGFNPVAVLMEKPTGRRLEAAWLEVPDAALVLESARRLRSRTDHRALPFTYELTATLLLTGGRLDEVLGLEVEDVSLERKTITFRPNAWRRLKTPGARRVVPLWPQLEEILRPYLNARTAAEVLDDAPARRLLFPGGGKRAEAKLGDIQKSVDLVAIQAGFREPVMDPETKEQKRDAKKRLVWRGTILSKMFRHTYCAARLQTLDHGAPVAVDTVRREMGHGSAEMVEKVYGHLGEVRHRSEVVEFRVEQHSDRLRERLASITTGAAEAEG